MTKPINTVNQADVTGFIEESQDQDMHLENLLNQYQTLAIRSAIYPGKGTVFGLMYAALGLAEAGEVQNKIKKIFRDDNALDLVDIVDRLNLIRQAMVGVNMSDLKTFNDQETFVEYLGHMDAALTGLVFPAKDVISPNRKNQIIKELGGLLWYIAATCEELGIKMSSVAEANLVELASRAERGALSGDGDDR